MNYIKHMAITFAKKNHLYGKEVTFTKLLKAARQNGYIVRTYSSHTTLIVLDLYDRAKCSNSVSMVDDSGNVMIFLDHKKPKSKQLFGLAHEIGHIILEHPPSEKDKRKYEREADLFAHYLLDANFDRARILNAIKILCCIIFVSLSAIIILLITENSTKSEKINAQTYSQPSTSDSSEHKLPYAQTPSPPAASSPEPIEQTTTCYFTESGKVYHLYRDCYHIKNSKKVRTGTVKSSDKPRVCETCKSRYY